MTRKNKPQSFWRDLFEPMTKEHAAIGALTVCLYVFFWWLS